MEYWHGKIRKQLNKDDLFVFLSQKSLKHNYSWKWEYIKNLNTKEIYYSFDDIILRNLYRMKSIQIYNDGCIRIHLKNDYYETPKSIIIDDYNLCYDEGTLTIIQYLDEYCKYN